MKHKRIVGIVTVVAILASISGCGNGSNCDIYETPQETAQTVVENNVEPESTVEADTSSDIDRETSVEVVEELEEVTGEPEEVMGEPSEVAGELTDTSDAATNDPDSFTTIVGDESQDIFGLALYDDHTFLFAGDYDRDLIYNNYDYSEYGYNELRANSAGDVGSDTIWVKDTYIVRCEATGEVQTYKDFKATSTEDLADKWIDGTVDFLLQKDDYSNAEASELTSAGNGWLYRTVTYSWSKEGIDSNVTELKAVKVIGSDTLRVLDITAYDETMPYIDEIIADMK